MEEERLQNLTDEQQVNQQQADYEQPYEEKPRVSILLIILYVLIPLIYAFSAYHPIRILSLPNNNEGWDALGHILGYVLFSIPSSILGFILSVVGLIKSVAIKNTQNRGVVNIIIYAFLTILPIAFHLIFIFSR